MRETASTSFHVDWGVVGDLDMIAILKDSGHLFDRRKAEWDIRKTPMSIDLLIHTKGKLNSIKRAGRFCRTLDHETFWV